jgi:hypothetical protein
MLKCNAVVQKEGVETNRTNIAHKKRVEGKRKKGQRRLRTESTVQIGCAAATD